MQSTSSPSDQPAPRSLRLHVRVVPGAPRSEIVGRYGDGWKVRVRSAPERGRANDQVVSLLADVLRVTRHDVTLVSGHTSRDKIVVLHGLTPDEVSERLSRSAPV